MEAEDLEKELEYYGLSKKESMIYLYLLIGGSKEVLDITRTVNKQS